MRAGTSKVDITPDLNAGATFMTGYTSKLNMPAMGIHDPLYARTLILNDGVSQVAIVASISSA